MTINTFTFLALGVCGFMIALRQIMLSPTNESFPCAPAGVRVAMFLAAVGVGAIAVLFLGPPSPYAGAAAVPVAILSAVMAFYNTIMAWNVVGQRLAPGVWRRIERAQATARRRKAAPEPTRGFAPATRHRAF